MASSIWHWIFVKEEAIFVTGPDRMEGACLQTRSFHYRIALLSLDLPNLHLLTSQPVLMLYV